MRKFRKIHCGRSVAEQKYIHAKCLIYEKLPETERSEIRALVADIAAGTNYPQSGKNLLRVLTECVTPETEAARSYLPAGLLYKMQREFYRRYTI